MTKRANGESSTTMPAATRTAPAARIGTHGAGSRTSQPVSSHGTSPATTPGTRTRKTSVPSAAPALRTASPRPRRLDGLLDLAGLEAARADVGPLGLSAEQDANALEVRVEPPPRGDHRVAAVVPERGLLPADCAHLRHGGRQCSGSTFDGRIAPDQPEPGLRDAARERASVRLARRGSAQPRERVGHLERAPDGVRGVVDPRRGLLGVLD